jgi:hypothetical protein
LVDCIRVPIIDNYSRDAIAPKHRNADCPIPASTMTCRSLGVYPPPRFSLSLPETLLHLRSSPYNQIAEPNLPGHQQPNLSHSNRSDCIEQYPTTQTPSLPSPLLILNTDVPRFAELTAHPAARFGDLLSFSRRLLYCHPLEIKSCAYKIGDGRSFFYLSIGSA